MVAERIMDCHSDCNHQKRLILTEQKWESSDDSLLHLFGRKEI